MQFGPNIDLEKPYQDACDREDRYQEILAGEKKRLWDELQDEQFGAKFIYHHIADPGELLSHIMQAIAECETAKPTAESITKAYNRILYKLEEHVDSYAESKAQEIYDWR